MATQGRDHYVKIAIEGALFPFGHRATWVQVTERRFETSDSLNGAPVARLREYSYVLVRQRERSYDPAGYLNGGRENPLGQAIRITTVVTPHLLSPGDTGANGASPDCTGHRRLGLGAHRGRRAVPVPADRSRLRR